MAPTRQPIGICWTSTRRYPSDPGGDLAAAPGEQRHVAMVIDVVDGRPELAPVHLHPDCAQRLPGCLRRCLGEPCGIAGTSSDEPRCRSRPGCLGRSGPRLGRSANHRAERTRRFQSPSAWLHTGPGFGRRSWCPPDSDRQLWGFLWGPVGADRIGSRLAGGQVFRRWIVLDEVSGDPARSSDARPTRRSGQIRSPPRDDLPATRRAPDLPV